MSSTTRRPHDAEASRRALLDAAAQLFQERGYEGATVREIGERAGVDAALIARYFDGKEGLYLAALADERYSPPHAQVGEGDLAEVTRMLFEHWDENGASPAVRTIMSPTPTAQAREQVRAIFGRVLLDPLAEQLGERGLSHPRRRAELLLGALVGIQTLRLNGMLGELEGASTAELLELLEPMARALQSPEPD
ncbi:TetR/AcrR family transcriptional regulator [Conexibacter sp. CPCC 206217]|uniref:TetR/AcrR family transcriptional regulator n=1 Tax=Conexibacter sp. CPCC 206217 TaxID=3064574 RepID=UPI00271574FD|nr:TetR/AcrR family transcriptional regulator [Conexibacter sp. CPCC 206217]MDO8211137.1 TetR family transcriptional regulator [Conexibacter sp. CPCC 206217]